MHSSVTMDSWSAEQLKKMGAGGNGKVNSFLAQYGVDKYMDIAAKYNTKAAEVSFPSQTAYAFMSALLWQ
jgi:hypothetical protein